MQQAYYQRSPFNLVRIILGLPELFDAERGESVYTRAARDLNAWREQGILIQEKDPCIFAYSQRFKVPGTDTVNLTVVVGGHSFTASLDVTVTPTPQTLTSVAIVSGAPQGV